MSAAYRKISIREWPNKDCRPIAVLRLEPEELAQRLGVEFSDDADDLDYVKYVGLLLSTGDQVLLVRHLRAPVTGTELYADVGASLEAVRHAFLVETGLQAADFSWVLDDDK